MLQLLMYQLVRKVEFLNQIFFFTTKICFLEPRVEPQELDGLAVCLAQLGGGGQSPDLHVHSDRNPGSGSKQVNPICRGSSQAQRIRRSPRQDIAGHHQRPQLKQFDESFLIFLIIKVSANFCFYFSIPFILFNRIDTNLLSRLHNSFEISYVSISKGNF